MHNNDHRPIGLFKLCKKAQSVRLTILFICFLNTCLFANNGLIIGEVRNELTNEPIEFATILVHGTDIGVTTDALGQFRLELAAGLYNLEVSFLGYETEVLYSKSVSTAQPIFLEVLLSPRLTALEEYKVVGNKNSVSPIYSDKISAF